MSHTFIVVSPAPEARYFPFGLNFTELTLSSCALSIVCSRINVGYSKFHICMVPSTDPDESFVPSGVKSKVRVVLVLPVKDDVDNIVEPSEPNLYELYLGLLSSSRQPSDSRYVAQLYLKAFVASYAKYPHPSRSLQIVAHSIIVLTFTLYPNHPLAQ